jgi:hypothetical protein
MKQHVAIIETDTDNGFHPEPIHRKGNHNDTPNRVTTPACIVLVSAGALSFLMEKSSRHYPLERK